MHPPLDLQTTRTAAGACTLTVAGELDVATAPELRAAVSSLLGSGCRSLVLDLSAVTFLDSSGLGALLWASHRLHGAGGELAAVRPSDRVAEILEMSGVGRLLAEPVAR